MLQKSVQVNRKILATPTAQVFRLADIVPAQGYYYCTGIWVGNTFKIIVGQNFAKKYHNERRIPFSFWSKTQQSSRHYNFSVEAKVPIQESLHVLFNAVS